jgi:sugar (pentulose or hexulose) kinase
MLNSGFQSLWLKTEKPGVFQRVEYILHFPQYLSFFLTGKVSSEHTSIGCHTALWDFDEMRYHDWTGTLGNVLPNPEPAETVYPSRNLSGNIPVGIGIHDSSSSLVPYFMESAEEFILVSTGTWNISMNPFNASPLTPEQLKADCLAYMSIQQKQVKSSRLFMGHIHDVNVRRLAGHFGVSEDAYKKVSADPDLIRRLIAGEDRVFFGNGIPEDYIDAVADPSQFKDFNEAYHRFMTDLTGLAIEAIDLIREENDRTRNIYITGGFSKNPIFTQLLAEYYRDKKVHTSEIPNATSLGAALVLWKAIEPGFKQEVDMGLKPAGGV